MSIVKRGKKGVYYVDFVVGGQRVFKSSGKYTRKEAKQFENHERQKLVERSKLSPEELSTKTLLSDAIDKEFEMRWKHTRDSMGAYRRALKLVELIGNIPLGTINPHTIDTLMKKLVKNSTTPATQNRYLTALKTILKDHQLPAHFIRLKRENNSRTRIITREEEAAFISTLLGIGKPDYTELADLIQVLADTGLRLSEALGLTYKENINFATNLIISNRNKSDKPKSCPMTKRVREILSRRQEANPTKPFTLTKYQADRIWKWAKGKLGVGEERQLVLHTWRHVFASRLVSAGVDLYVVKELLSHSSIKLTERYSHLDPGKLVHAVEVLEV